MTSDLPDTIEISKALLKHVGDASVAGHTYIDDQGLLIVRLSALDDAGKREIHVHEGDVFDFAGAKWRMAIVHEPTIATRGRVATLTRVQ